MSPLGIPRAFTLVNRKWRVKLLREKAFMKALGEWEGNPPKGATLQSEAIIILNLDVHSSVEDLLHTWYHELVHALLFADGALDHDEEFVDRVGGFLHQALHSQGKLYVVRSTGSSIALDTGRGSETQTLRRHRRQDNHRRREKPYGRGDQRGRV